jgi:hypothetical protein
MEQQPDIALSMRHALIEFITDLHSAYFLRPETLFLAINVMDRYASKRVIHKRHYQLVGCAALLAAAKYEDSKENQPLTCDLKRYCREIYDVPAFRQMECHILKTLDYDMSHPTCEAWLRAFTTGIDRSCSDNMKMEIERNGWGHVKDIESRGIPMECFDANANSIGRCLMETMQYKEELIEVTPCAVAEAAMILTKAIYYSRRDVSYFFIRVLFCDSGLTFFSLKRGLETSAGLQVARYMDELLARHPRTIPDNLARKYGPDTPEDAYRRINRWFLGERIPTHGTFLFLDTIVDHDPDYPDAHTPISEELLDFQRRQREAHALKEEEEERERIAALLELERQEEERAAAEEEERQRRADETAFQLELLQAKHDAMLRARAEAELQARAKEEEHAKEEHAKEERAQLRPSESFDSGYGSVGGDEAEREAVEDEAERKVTVKAEAAEATKVEDKENVDVKRPYPSYDESDSEAERAEVKGELLRSAQSSPEV